MTHRSGYVISKRTKKSFLTKKYLIKVRFDKAYDKNNNYEAEYEVDNQMYENIIIGAFIRGEFEQSPNGLKPIYIY